MEVLFPNRTTIDIVRSTFENCPVISDSCWHVFGGFSKNVQKMFRYHLDLLEYGNTGPFVHSSVRFSAEVEESKFRYVEIVSG